MDSPRAHSTGALVHLNPNCCFKEHAAISHASLLFLCGSLASPGSQANCRVPTVHLHQLDGGAFWHPPMQ